MPSSLLPARPTVLIAVLGCLIFTGGCETTGANSAARETMLNDYQAGRYREAYDAARDNLRRGSPADRAHARYIAGASAYQLGRNSEAARHLAPLTGHSDRELAGRANATLGLIHLRRNRHEQAIASFERAADRLQGEDRAHAYYHLAVAQQRLGRWTQARTSLSHAINHSNDRAFRREVQQRLATTGFTLQLGAFSRRANADRAARESRSVASRAGIGSPRVVPSTAGDGARLYLVQVGSFASFDSAVTARRRLGRTDAIITVMSR